MKRLSLLLFAVVLSACATAPQTATSGLTFVHLNDTYRVGAVEDGNAGGFSRVVSLIRELQSEGRDVRILHGGDFLYPSLESQLWNGLQMIEAFNFMDAIAPMYAASGNHEFDRRGPEQLIAAVRQSQFDWLGDNFVFRTGEADVDSALRSAFTFRAGDKKIGVFSLTLNAKDGGNKRDYLEINGDYLGVAEKTLQTLEAKGVDLIIGVTHLHMWTDVEIAGLKAEHPKLAFIVGGHEHEPEYRPGGDTSAVVMKGASNARVIWVIDIDFDDAGQATVRERRIKLDESIALDPEYEILAGKWRGRLLDKYPFLEARIGTAAVPLDGREVTVRNEESNWANFIVDQMRIAFGETADLAFINGGTLRLDDFVAGDILFEDIGRTFGFTSFLRLTTLTGAEFREVLEAGYRGAGPSKGYFPQVSGFRVCIDRSRPSRDRIVSLQVPAAEGWQEIAADDEYSVVVPDFLFGGGDGYEIPKDRPATPPGSELKYLVLDGILRAQAQGRKVGAPVDPDNRRFHELEAGNSTCFQ
ncbi:MAG: bifunctional metallophosphatase/5'-nucleotidase [Gammaproteobacteria bacterium]|nr:bifunctional metallophosphatase/5'-nucleotidase [Gammaproteobacteria bacterium]MBT8111726.1 bifunctional metallophosphatase/5'-nucleotidase [Gammaproteobacteria bacterium]NNL46425.1 bifunctional metallophosphatase/5'-nucleotidase [Woeseiaceae bacterium]